MRRLRFKRGHMKNNRKQGKSARHGNAPSPYTKYGKTPYKYDFKAMERRSLKAAELGLTYIEYYEKNTYIKENVSQKRSKSKARILEAAE